MNEALEIHVGPRPCLHRRVIVIIINSIFRYAIYLVAYSEAQRDIYGRGKKSKSKYDENKYVLRPDLNDSTDFALCTLEGSAFQRTGALVANAFSPNEQGVNIPVPEESQISTGNIFRNQIIKIMRSKTMNNFPC